MKQTVFRELMLRDLAEILGCTPGALPAIFLEAEPKPLKIGISNDMLARYPPAPTR